MPVLESSNPIVDEIADLLASNPTAEQILKFRPSGELQMKARELLAKANAGTLTDEEDQELQQFQHAELLMRLVKARLRERTW